MLTRLPQGASEQSGVAGAAIEEAELSLLGLLDLVQRWRGLFIASILAFLLLAVAFIMLPPPQYTARATMLIDSNTSRGLDLQTALNLAGDAPFVDTQVEVLKSENIALAVINRLKILENERYLAPLGAGAVLGQMISALRTPEPISAEEKLRGTVEAFARRLDVRRIGRTYAFEIQFTSIDAELAAQVANAVVEVYVLDQLDAKFTASQRASLWLLERLRELGKQANDAERAVVEFKNKNNIIESGKDMLMNEQQLGEINSQLVTARAATAEARAKLDRINEILAVPDPTVADASVTDALGNEVIIKLRNQFADLAKREADWVVRLGPAHLSVINIRNDMREIKKSIREELKRIGQGYRSDFEIAKSRQQSIEESLGLAVNQSQLTSKAQVDLKELQSTAQSYRTLYDSFLQRQLEATQQQSFPLTEARAVTVATPPLLRSNPSPVLVVVLAIFAGAMVGGGLVMFKELSDQTLRSSDAVEATFGLPCIASIPMLDKSTLSSQLMKARNPFMRECIREPMGRLAENLRELKVAIDLDPGGRRLRVIGFVSSVPGEGKTTIASNFAELMAHAGSRVILIDGDLRRHSLTNAVAPKGSKKGLLEVLEGHCKLEDVLINREDTSLKILPVFRERHRVHTSDLLSSGAMRTLLEGFRKDYDLVVVDLPPLMPIIDARAVAPYIDGLVFVAKWGKTRKSIIRAGLTCAPVVQERVIGIVLSQVDMKVATRYENYSYYNQYSNYYTT